MILYCTTLLHTCLSTASHCCAALLSFRLVGLSLPVVSPLLLASSLHVPLLADCCVHPPLLPPPAAVTKKSFHHHIPRRKCVMSSTPLLLSALLSFHCASWLLHNMLTCCLCYWCLCCCWAHANALIALASSPLLRWHLCHHCRRHCNCLSPLSNKSLPRIPLFG